MTFSFRIEHLLLFVFAVTCLPCVSAFGAGDIPDFAFLEGKAFRHGDIEGILEDLYKNVGKSQGFGGGAAGFIMGVASALATGGKGQRFSKKDVKRVYFGNWLRDYSQAVDIAGLSKLTAQSLVTVISILGFLSFGYATEEYQVTAERLGTYLPVEHIDNPRGYAAAEGDARQYHPKLRPPVDNRELEIDQNNGMKNYIATENQGWDTSTAHIRRVLVECINKARSSGGNDGPDLYEAYRLLGTALHTLEDLLAHSNWCELTLLKMGHDVFCHVGDNVKVNSPNGQAPPLVTGTFGGADFLHSLMGESQDHLSESSVSDLSAKMQKAKSGNNSNIDTIKALISQVPASGGANSEESMQKGEQLKNNAINLDPDKVAPEELQQRLWEILVWRDNTMRDISRTIEKIPGLSTLLEELNLAMMEYVFTVIEPWLSPLLIKTTSALKEGSDAVINTDDQYEVWNNPNASDPSHSMLSKDHFGLILNEPAGKVAKVVVTHSVNVIVNAWFDQNVDTNEAINKVLEAFHHPFYATGSSEVQNAMQEEFNKWFGSLGSDQTEIINRLSKESVRDHKHVRLGSEDNTQLGTGHGGHQAHAQPKRQQPQQSQQTYQGGGYQKPQQSSYGQTTGGGYGRSTRDESSNQYGSGGYGSSQREETTGYGGGYSSTRRDDTETSGGYGRARNTEESGGYGKPRGTEESGGYGRSRQTEESTGYGRPRQTEESTGYGRPRQTEESTGYGGGYGRSRDTEESTGYSGGHSGGYGGGAGDSDRYGSSGYGRGNQDDSNEGGYSGGYSGGYGGGGGKPSGGYGGGGGKPGGGYGRDNEDTFGAERLNLDDNQAPKRYGYGNDYS